MRLFLLSFSLFIISNSIVAQSDCGCTHRCDCTIEGRVYDFETEQPLPYATVSIEGKDMGAVADENGLFRLSQICECDVNLSVSYTGYKSKIIDVHADHPKFLNVYLAPDSKLLESVIILGEKRDNQLHSQTIKTIKAKAIEENAGKSLGNLLSGVSGVNQIETGNNISKPTIHGQSGNRVLILNNGLRLEGQQWGVEHAPPIDPMIAQRMEVIKGAASVKYGAGAIGGVILILPPELPTEGGLSGILNLSGQSNGRMVTSSGMLESAIKDGIGWRVQGTYKRGGDLKTPDYYLTNTGVKEYNFSAALGKQSENAEYELFFSRFNTEVGILRASGLSSNVEDLQDAIGAEIPEGTKSFSYEINNPRQEVNHTLLKAKSKWYWGEDNLELTYGFQQNARKEYDIRRGSLNDIPSMDLKLITHSLDASYQYNRLKNHSLNLGLNLYAQQNSNNPGTQTIPFIPNFNLYSGGLYAIDHWALKKFSLEGGLRGDFQYLSVSGRDNNNEVFRSELSFNSFSELLGVKYNVNAQDYVVLNISTGWRPPHVSELYSSGTHQSAAAIEYGLLLDNSNNVLDIEATDLKSEQSIKSVLSYEHHGDKMHVDVSGYYQIIDNYFFLKAFGLTTNTRGTFPTYRYRQTKAVFSGLDVDLEYNPIEPFSISGHYSYLYSRDVTNDDQFLYIPGNRMMAKINYHFKNLGLVDHMDIYTSSSYHFKQVQAPRIISAKNIPQGENQDNFDFIDPPDAYVLLEVGISMEKKWADNSLEWLLAGENILNTTYRSYSNRLKYFAEDKGVNIRMSIIYHF